MTTKTKLQATFLLEKETKNTRKFEEVPEPGQAPMIGTLYVQKHVLHNLGNPDRLTVTIEA
jgi:hypothetical protein